MSTLAPREVALFYFASFYCLVHQIVFCLDQWQEQALLSSLFKKESERTKKVYSWKRRKKKPHAI